MDAGDSAGEQARGLDDLGRDQPVGRPALARLFALVGAEQSRAGKNHHLAVARGLIDIALLLARHTRKQAGEHRAVDRVIPSGFSVEAEAFYLVQGLADLRVDIAPFAHPHVGEVVRLAEFAQLVLRGAFHFVVIGIPNVEIG